MKNAKKMRAIALKAQERNKRDEFYNIKYNIKKEAKNGSHQLVVSFKKNVFTKEELQNFSNYLTSKGYDICLTETDGIKYLMYIKW